MTVIFASGLRAADEGAKPVDHADDAAATTIVTSNSPAVLPPVATNAAPAAPLVPQQLSLPPLLDQVVRLSKSGTDESVVRAYVEKAASPYQITGNDIIQLQDLGVSKNVILALIEHSKTATSIAAEVPPGAPAQEPEAQAAPPTNAPPPTSDAAADYYSALSPYGTWTDVPGYGWCWQPTVVVVNPGWRPYWDNGYWLWSDCGWYWNSCYSWGWAPFHYGRWFSHANSWYWCPDRVWGPSWVCWRNSGAFCGWAPLPPGACFTAGIGWTHHGVAVGVNFGFGIASAHFNFVSHDHFADHHVSHFGLHGHDANTAFAQTRVVNNYSIGANHRVFNHGIGREQVAAASGHSIQPVSATALTRQGRELSTHAFAANSRSVSGMNTWNASRTSRSTVASTAPRLNWQSSSGAGNARTAPNFPAASRAPAFQQPQVSRNNSAATIPRMNTVQRANTVSRASAAPQFQPRYSAGGVARSAVAPRSFSTPSAAPRQFAPQSFAARPSF